MPTTCMLPATYLRTHTPLSSLSLALFIYYGTIKTSTATVHTALLYIYTLYLFIYLAIVSSSISMYYYTVCHILYV